jgi:hypothetical protein
LIILKYRELGGGVMASSFVRALHLADGMVTVTDADAVVLTRVWCGLEAYVATSLRGAQMQHHIYTARSFPNACGDAVGAVGLVDGFADADLRQGAGNPAWKAQREAAFPPQLAERAASFDLARAEASEAADKVAIVEAVGARAETLNATVRARYSVGLLPTLLEGGDPQRLAAYCAALAASELRGLSLYCGGSPSAEAAGPRRERRAAAGAQPLVSARAAGLRRGEGRAGGERRGWQGMPCAWGACAMCGGWGEETAAEAAAGCVRVSLPFPNLKSPHSSPLPVPTPPVAAALYARENEIGAEGASALAKCLEHNTALASLDLGRARDKGGCAAMGKGRAGGGGRRGRLRLPPLCCRRDERQARKGGGG